MVLSRRHWLFIVLPLILLMLLTACERPLASNDSETAEESAEATAVAETAEAESAVEPDAEADEEADADDADEEADEETAEEVETEGEADTAEEAESSDPDVGGGTPDTVEEEEVTSEAEDDQSDTEDTAAGEAVSEEATTESESEEVESTDDSEVDSAVDGSDSAETDDVAASESDAGAAEEPAAEESAETADQVEAESGATLPATHTVQPGENLYRIGLKYGMSWVTLAAYNNLPNPNYIRVGQVLQIPGGSTPNPVPPPSTPDEPGYTNYVVQPGDTLNSIGRKFGVSWVEIAEANGIVNPNLIYAGQVLKIPTSQPETPPSLTHTVQPRETLYRISLQYGVHWLSIAQTNNIAPPYVIYPGQVLAIPSG